MRKDKKTRKHTFIYYHYLGCIVVFLCVLLVGIMVFISAVQERSDINTKENIMKSVQRQKEHFQIFLEAQYSDLEGLAYHIARSEDLMDEDNFVLLRDFVRLGPFHRITVFYPDGTGKTSDGTPIKSNKKPHFMKALEGKHGLSDPGESRLDGQVLVALTVPVFVPESDEVKGVLTASYDVALLSHLMFDDLYDGEGTASIASGEGELITATSNEKVDVNNSSFFDFYSTCDFLTGSFEHMKEDFGAGEEDCLIADTGTEIRYIAYMPMGLDDWMVCYALPLAAARATYAFATDYTVRLSVTLAVTVILMVMASWFVTIRREKDLTERAETDALTGILNRESTMEKIGEWLTADVYDEYQALLMLDLDKFKTINDTFGHSVGDEVLCQTAALLKRTFRGSDVVGRLGGDEFIVLMKNVRMESVVSFYMKEVCRELSELEIPELEGKKIYCSIGAACAPTHGKTFQELYDRADKALYAVKRNGRNNGKIYTIDDEVM